MPTLAAPLDFAKLEGRNQRVHQLSTAPSSPVTGQMYYNTTDNTLYWWNNTAWVAASAGAGGPPTGAAGGDLAGSTYPNPIIAPLAVTDAKVAAANKDGTAGTPSMRTIGTGALQAMAGNTRHDTIAVPTGSVDLNNQKIVNLLAPSTGTDAANKAYVDSVAQGLDVKASCRAASTANLSLAAPGATIDGVVMAPGDRVLLKDQTTGSQNGIYVWTGSAATLTRATDADVSAEVTAGMFTFIEEGTTNADTGWVLTTNAPITLDTTSLAFTQFAGAGLIVAGAGLTKTGNSIDVIGTANRITVAADSVDISTAYVGQATITTLGTITTGVWNGTAIPVANGGTGQITAKAGREIGLGAAGYYSSATHGAGTSIVISQATHGLRTSRGLLVQCQLESDGSVIMPDILVSAAGDVTVNFSVSQSANTIRVTIIG
jgi:hypothetical protein